MAMSKPAMLSAFLCPGVGQWVAGKRVLGAMLITAAVVSAGSPFLRFIVGLVQPHDCGDLLASTHGVLAYTARCSWIGVSDALRATARTAAIGFPCFAVVWSGSVLHASRLTVPGTPRGSAAPPPPANP